MRTYTFVRTACGHKVRGANKDVCKKPCIDCYAKRINEAPNQSEKMAIEQEYIRRFEATKKLVKEGQ